MASKFVNTYSPSIPDIPSDIHLHTPPEQYDFNFVFPVQNIRSNRVELRPFVVSSFPSPSKGNSHTDIGPPLQPSLHAQSLWGGIKDHRPEITRWLASLDSLEDILVWHEKTFHRNPVGIHTCLGSNSRIKFWLIGM